MMNRFFTLLLAASCLTAVGQVTYPYNPDGNADGDIAVGDLQDFLTVYGNPFSPSEIMVGDSSLTYWVEQLSFALEVQQSRLDSLLETGGSGQVQYVDAEVAVTDWVLNFYSTCCASGCGACGYRPVVTIQNLAPTIVIQGFSTLGDNLGWDGNDGILLELPDGTPYQKITIVNESPYRLYHDRIYNSGANEPRWTELIWMRQSPNSSMWTWKTHYRVE